MPGIIAILISAPLKDLEQRIRNRDDASMDFIKKRMAYTKKWLQHKNIYDYEVINRQGELDQTIKQVAQIIKKYC